jgi:hypothetical protein
MATKTGAPSTTTTTRSSRAAAHSNITNYFLVILCGFGLLTLFVNLQHGGIDQLGSIGSFQEQHFGKFRSGKERAAIKKGEDTTRVEERLEEVDDDVVDETAAAAQHTLAGLNCDKYGGPSLEVASEMIYWQDVPSDNTFVSPFFNKKETQYLTFESDHGGWNVSMIHVGV